MSVRYDPVIESGSNPKSVDTASDNAEQEPLDPVSEELSAGTVKGKSLAINNSMTDDELPHVTNSPGSTDAASNRNNKTCYDRIYNSVKNSSVPT
jgi:hypothetical protein